MRFAALHVRGPGVTKLRAEAGEHVFQHRTSSRKKDRIHTSVVSVRVLPIAGKVEISPELVREIRVETFRGSGPGGQHKNVTDTAVRATHKPSGQMATVSSGRSQSDNIDRAIEVLCARIKAERQQGQEARRQQLRRAQEGPVRTYDMVRGMIRDRRHGKSRSLDRVLAGELDSV